MLFLLIHSLTHRLFRNLLFNFQRDWLLPDIFLLWISNSILLWISIWSNLENVACALEKHLYSEVLGMFYKFQVKLPDNIVEDIYFCWFSTQLFYHLLRLSHCKLQLLLLNCLFFLPLNCHFYFMYLRLHCEVCIYIFNFYIFLI